MKKIKYKTTVSFIGELGVVENEPYIQKEYGNAHTFIMFRRNGKLNLEYIYKHYDTVRTALSHPNGEVNIFQIAREYDKIFKTLTTSRGKYPGRAGKFWPMAPKDFYEVQQSVIGLNDLDRFRQMFSMRGEYGYNE